jgi:hypothetical protein
LQTQGEDGSEDCNDYQFPVGNAGKAAMSHGWLARSMAAP